MNITFTLRKHAVHHKRKAYFSLTKIVPFFVIKVLFYQSIVKVSSEESYLPDDGQLYQTNIKIKTFALYKKQFFLVCPIDGFIEDNKVIFRIVT